MIHELKCWPEPFEEIRLGVKTYEVRHEDGMKRFNAGDVLRLREWDPHRGYTRRQLDVVVRHMLRLYETPSQWQIRGPGVVMAIERLNGKAVEWEPQL